MKAKQEIEADERFMDMDADSRTITGIFMSGDDVERMQRMVESIAENANAQHRAECEHNNHCRGVMPYALNGLKSFLIVHPELTELERLAVVGSLMFSMGATTAEEQNDDLPEDMPEELKRMMREGKGFAMKMPDSFPAFMKKHEIAAKKAGMPLADYMANVVTKEFFDKLRGDDE